MLLTICLVLTNLGEKMSDEEVDELLKAVDTSSGEINYTGMFGPSFLPKLRSGPR
jgi:Ca2+-binding EF-hand superfamily protein